MNEKELEIKLIDWIEVQRQVDLIKGNRESGWNHSIPSPDGKLIAEYKYVDEIRFGPAFYSVQILNAKSKEKIWDGNGRLFGMPPQKDFISPWSIDSDVIGFVEWNSKKTHDQFPVFVDLKKMKETKIDYVGSLIVQFLTIDKKHVVLRSSGKENKIILANFNNDIIDLGLYKPHRKLLVSNTINPHRLIVIDQLDKPRIKILNTTTGQILDEIIIAPDIFEKLGHLDNIPNDKDIFSGDKELGNLKLGATSKLSQDNEKGKVWDDLIWDYQNDRYFLGIMRANSWGQNDYYKGQEWIEFKL